MTECRARAGLSRVSPGRIVAEAVSAELESEEDGELREDGEVCNVVASVLQECPRQVVPRVTAPPVDLVRRRDPVRTPALTPVAEIPWASHGGGGGQDEGAGGDVVSGRARVVRLVRSSVAVSTWKSDEQAWLEFLRFGAVRQRDKWRREEQVVQFMLGLMDRGLARVTIAGKLAGVAFMGKLWWGYAPSAGELGGRLLEGWEREKGARVRQRRPITEAMLEGLLNRMPVVCRDQEEAVRFSTLMSWLYFGAFRVSELVGLKGQAGVRWGDVEFRGREVAVRLRRSKTDQRERGTWVVLGPGDKEAVCPVEWGRRLAAGGTEAGTEVFDRGEAGRVTAAQLLWVLRHALRSMGEDPKDFGTHSFRIGAATEAARRGWGKEDIKRLGRWKSDCFKTYVRLRGVAVE
ncbi:uncharacterized protein LOC144761851 [Lissotriton helveticus]